MKVQEKIEIELWNATRQIGPLRERIQEKTLLEELELELKSKEICINELKQKWADVGASYAYLIAEKEKMAQEAEESRRVLADVYLRRDEAEAEIEMAKDGLFSCLG
ncbi:hypothetical protein QQP08_010735 [Theobroma cacao]|uniref:Uncharacterized protein n=1 Tax=Theobroma cacao TaxID=3641 RepID=A0A061G6C6_THECC|nr:Uncharacterized protein TCM_016245 [Theobroma cacao]WRX18248.1 hypothetical protein QQP08_010735 [Theobroma cacao]